jgi:competence protein ComEA
MQQVSGLFSRRTLIVAAVAFGVVAVFGIWLLVGSFTHSSQPPVVAAAEQPLEQLPTAALPAEAATDAIVPTMVVEPNPLVVYVSGAVIAPDVYRLPDGARIKDVIVAAGGFSADADPEAINLAARIADAQQIKVPRQGEAVAPASAAPADASVPAGGGLINLNSATVADLDTLPGIGSAIAQRIVDYRIANGPFKSIDDLRNVKGIGAALFEKIAPLVTIGT